MVFSRLATALSLYIILVASESIKLNPSTIKDIHGSHSSESLEVLSTFDTHAKGSVSFDSYDSAYNGLFVFQYYSVIPINEVKITFNYLGEGYAFDLCVFPQENLQCKTWHAFANMSGTHLKWTTSTFSFAQADELTHIFGPSGEILLRFTTPYAYNFCYLDFVELELVAKHPTGANQPHILAPRDAYYEDDGNRAEARGARTTGSRSASTGGAGGGAEAGESTTTGGFTSFFTSNSVIGNMLNGMAASILGSAAASLSGGAAGGAAGAGYAGAAGAGAGGAAWPAGAGGASASIAGGAGASAGGAAWPAGAGAGAPRPASAPYGEDVGADHRTQPYYDAESGSGSDSESESEYESEHTYSSSSSEATVAPVATIGGVTVDFSLRFLVLHKGSSSKLSWVKLACDGVGMPCDYVSISSRTDLADYLATSGTGRYAGIVVVGNLLSTNQMNTVISYQNTYAVKLVVVGSDPKKVNGLTQSPRGTTSSSGTISISTAFHSFAKSLRLDLTLPSKGSITPAEITDPAIATPALFVTLDSDTYVLAALVSSPTPQLHYFGDLNPDYTHSRAYTALFINWLAPAGTYQGARRIFVNAQADDFLLPTFLWDIESSSNPFKNSYRMTGSDLRNLLSQLRQINSQLPPYSNVTVEWPFNGAGVAEAGGPTQDELYKTAQELQGEFFFLSHTFRHPCTLDSDSYDFAFEELSLNIPIAEQLFYGGTSAYVYSPTSMVNPCITGLFNGNVLRAMKANGIYNAVGDNSVPRLVSPNPYHIIETTQDVHGEPGVYIIPRHAADIYYDVSTPEESAAQYNSIYGTSLSYVQVMTKQVKTAVNHLLAYRHDPTMFHQANARSFEINGRAVSHIGNWIEGVSIGISQFYTLPVWSIKQDMLAEVWKQRTNMDNAEFSVTLKISDSSIVGVWTTSNYDCIGTISGITLNSHPNVRQEWYGPEVTSYITQPGGSSQYFTLSSPLHL